MVLLCYTKETYLEECMQYFNMQIAPAHFKMRRTVLARHKLLTTHKVESPTRYPFEGVPTASSQLKLANYILGPLGTQGDAQYSAVA